MITTPLCDTVNMLLFDEFLTKNNVCALPETVTAPVLVIENMFLLADVIKNVLDDMSMLAVTDPDAIKLSKGLNVTIVFAKLPDCLVKIFPSATLTANSPADNDAVVGTTPAVKFRFIRIKSAI
jgi:hypothetical protein